MNLRAALGAFFLFVAGPAMAETELERFLASIPPQARLAFAKYDVCASLAMLGTKTTLGEIELAIANDCGKGFVKEADQELAEIRMPEAERRKTIERYLALSKDEHRLRYEGKPIPGYQMDRETAKIMECDRKMQSAVDDYKICVDDALMVLIPYSSDSSDVVADSALGMCVRKRHELVSAFVCYSSDLTKSQSNATRIDQQLRSTALGRVAAIRAEMRRRQVED